MSTPRPTKRASSSLSNTIQEGEFILNCKAAYLTVFSSIKDRIKSMDQLLLVLQQSGRNPTRKKLNKYRQDMKGSIGFENFCDICRKEPVTTSEDILKAFHRIDLNGDGYISHDELYKLMTTRGEKMSSQEARLLMEELDEDGDGRLNYREFCKMMDDTVEKTRQAAKRLMNGKVVNSKSSDNHHKPSATTSSRSNGNWRGEHRPNTPNRKKWQNHSRTGSASDDDDDDDDIVTQTSTPRQHASKKTLRGESVDQHRYERREKVLPAAAEACNVPEPKHLKMWTHLKSCGCFFLEESEVLSHKFQLYLSRNSNIWLTIHPVFGPETLSKKDPPIDTMLCVLKSGPEGTYNLVSLTEMKTKTKKFCLRCDLSAGTYILLPFTSGCRFRPRSHQPTENISLVKKSSLGEITLTKVFKKSLDTMFDLCDLDRNGRLSQTELGLFHYRTSEELLTNQEWQIVEERFDLDNGELTRKGFLSLHEMEAEDNDGDAEDLWITLDCMGINRALVLDHACQFELNVFVEDCPSASLSVKGIENGGVDLERAICQSVMSKGQSWPVKKMRDVVIHEYLSDVRYTAVIENKSTSVVDVCVDNSGSVNCSSNQGSLKNVLEVQPFSCKVSHFLVPNNEWKEWVIQSQANVL